MNELVIIRLNIFFKNVFASDNIWMWSERVNSSLVFTFLDMYVLNLREMIQLFCHQNPIIRIHILAFTRNMN